MGHIRLGTLSQSKKWREVVELLDTSAAVGDIAEAAAKASELDLKRASDDPNFQFVARLLVELPLWARSPDFVECLNEIGIGANAINSTTGLLNAIEVAVDRHSFEHGHASDAGELAKFALLESLSTQFEARLPSLFDPTSQEIRRALAGFSSGQQFAGLARDFFARLTYRSLDYYLSRELANHIGHDKRFNTDFERREFQRALVLHTQEASRIVEEFSGGWYGKTIWQKGDLSQEAINKFTRYAFKKMRDELGRRA